MDVGETYGGAVALYVGECAAPAREGPWRGCTATICGGWLPVRRRSSAVDLRGGGPLYAGGGRTPRKGGVVLASATSFSPFSHLCRALVNQPIVRLSLSLLYFCIIYSPIDSGLCERAAVRITRSRFRYAGARRKIICAGRSGSPQRQRARVFGSRPKVVQRSPGGISGSVDARGSPRGR